MNRIHLRIGLGVGLIIIQVLFLVIMRAVGQIDDTVVFFDMNVFLSKAEMTGIINQINQSVELRELVTQFYIVDAIYPFVYGTLIGSFLWFFRYRNIVYLITVGAIFDFLENTLILNALTEDTITNTIFYGLKAATSIKFIFILLSIVAIILFYRKERTFENDTRSD